MVFLFKDRSDINLIFLVLLSFGLHFHVWMHPPLVIANESDGLIAYLLIHFIKPLSPIILIILFQLIILSQAIRLNIPSIYHNCRLYFSFVLNFIKVNYKQYKTFTLNMLVLTNK